LKKVDEGSEGTNQMSASEKENRECTNTRETQRRDWERQIMNVVKTLG